MTHTSHDDLNKQILAASKIVQIGGVYKHYKYPERDYIVEKIAIQEATEKVCVLYKDISEPNAPSFVRDIDSWLENVEWHGVIVPRFKLVHTK
jgi:hypothetical protein